MQPWHAQRGENFAFATLARAAQRKFCFCILGAFAKNTKVERHFDTKHNGIAKKSLQKAFFGIFLQKPDARDNFFSLCKTAHFLIKHCIFSARAKIFAPRLLGEIFGGRPSAIIIADGRNPSRLSRFGEISHQEKRIFGRC